MPAASSKPAPQTTPCEGQDAAKQLVGVVDKKIRNLEKRKTKLDGYREMVTSGKVLNKDQEEAVAHFEEVGASLEFAKELAKQFTSILSEVTRAQKKEAKREKQQRHEQDLGKISEVLLLQNILFHMGQEHIRADFLAGSNGALLLEEEELSHLDEFFKLVSPNRDADQEDAGEDSDDDKSFDKKLETATSHLNCYLREDEREICDTTYKDLYQLVQRVHQCGYLDSLPSPPEDAVQVVEETPAPASYEPQEQEEAYEETLTEAPSESYYSGLGADQMQTTAMQAVPVEVAPLQGSIVSEPQQQQQLLSEMSPQSRVMDMPPGPEPIEMPPHKQPHHDVNEVLAPVLGSFNFVQDSMLDYDSPHMDPAVVAVSQQSYIPSSTFTNSVQSSSNSADLSQTDQSTLADSLANQQQLSNDQTYQSQSRYDGSQQGYNSQGMPDQTSYASQTIEFGGQADVEYGSSQTSSSGKLNELPEFPSPPVDTQLSKQQDQTVLQSSILHQQSLPHTSTQYGNEGYSQSIGSNQLASDGVTSSLSSQMTQGSSSSPLTITDPTQATIPLPGDQSSSDVPQGSIPPPKSTMNASAPPFQMTSSMRASPQMQAMQTSPPGQVGQAQDMSGFQGAMEQSQDFSHSNSRDANRTQSPTQDGKMNQSGGQSNDPPSNSYSNYQPYYNRNGRGNKPRGANPNFRGSRGSAPFIRGGPRYNTPQAPRGPGNFNTYVHRDTFAPRGPDMSYNPNARYGGFNQMQDQSFYQRRGGMPRGGQRGGRGGTPGGPRNQAPYRGGRGSFGKATPQVSA